MKNLLLSLLILVSASAFAQTTYTFNTYDPLEITAPDNTNTHILQLPSYTSFDIRIQFPTGNAGTVKVNAASSTMTGTGISTFSYTTDPSGIVLRATSKTGYKIYLLFSNAGDKVVVSRWY